MKSSLARHVVLALVGALMCAELFGLAQTPTGMELGASLDPARVRAGQAAFWAGYAVLCTPGALLVGYGSAPLLARAVRAVHLWLGAAGGATRGAAAMVVPSVIFGVLVALVRARSHLAGAPFSAILAAISALAIGLAVRRRVGASLGIMAVVIVAVSPLALLLSITNAQLASRAFVAIAIAAWLDARERGGMARWASVGLAAGVAVVASPLSSLLLAPLVLDSLQARARRREAMIGLAIGTLVPLASFVAHRLGVADPSVTPGLALSVPQSVSAAWTRFGTGCAYESLGLAVWFSGPFAAALVVLGGTTDRVTRLLAAGLVVHLAAGLFVDAPETPVAGPIASADCLAPLAILASHGIARALRWAERLELDRAFAGSVLAVGLLLPPLLFDAVLARACVPLAAEPRVNEQPKRTSGEAYGQIREPIRAMVRASPEDGSASGKSERQQAPKREEPARQAARQGDQAQGTR